MTVNRDKVIGMFLGVAIGDQLFMPVETFSPEEIAQRYGRITSYMRPPDDHRWFAGQSSRWTDDTQLTLAIADSLIACGAINMDNMAVCHLWSYDQEGDLGFGGSTRSAIQRLKFGFHWSESGKSDNPKHGYGNGLPMKIAPIGAYCCSPVFKNNRNAQLSFLEDVKNLTFMTHRTRLALESALVHIRAIECCLESDPANLNKASFLACTLLLANYAKFAKDESLMGRLEDLKSLIHPYDLLIDNAPADITARYGNRSYVYESLPSSYAFFLRNPISIETLYDVGNAGGDTDTNASIVGGLLGALNGSGIFPEHLINGLWQKDKIIETALAFCEKFEIKE